MSSGVQSYSCPRCRRGEFRSLSGSDGKAFCPWCGDAVSELAAAPTPPPDTPAPAEPASYAALAQRVATRPPDRVEVRPDDGLERLAEAERRRELAETVLRRELEKKQEIRKAVADELGRLEAQLAETKLRVRRKDEEHSYSLEVMAGLKEARERDWAAQLAAARELLGVKEKAFLDLEMQLKGRHKTVDELQIVLDAVRIDADRLRSELGKLSASSTAELGDLQKRLAAAEARLQSLKNADVQVRDLKGRLQETESKATGLQSELAQRDQRIKELQLLIKTLGERLNELTRRQF